MGQDGLRGCERIRATGGQVLAQDAASSVVWGMLGVVARAGLADAALPLAQLGLEIVRRVLKGRSLNALATHMGSGGRGDLDGAVGIVADHLA